MAKTYLMDDNTGEVCSLEEWNRRYDELSEDEKGGMSREEMNANLVEVEWVDWEWVPVENA